MQNPFESFSIALKSILNEPLPGLEAQMLMAPGYRKNWMRLQKMKFPDDAKLSAVCCFLFPKNDEWHFLLMKRVTYPGVHSGQISFPGGRMEEGETPRITAMREFEEETGLKLETENIIGALTKVYIPPSNFIVYPFLAIVENEPKFNPDKQEVEYLIEVPLRDLTDDQKIKMQEKEMGGAKVEIPYFDLNNEFVWGATAIMLSEVKAILKKVK